MADATRHNDIVTRLRMFAVAVVLLARLRRAQAAAEPSDDLGRREAMAGIEGR